MSGKILEYCDAHLENTDVYYTGDYTCIYVNFLAFHEIKHHKFKVQKLGSHLVYRRIH